MGFKRTYRARPVKQVDLALVSEGRGQQGAHVGFDMGKKELLAVVRWANGDFERPWLVKNPDELQVLVGLLTRMAAERPLTLVMEPTGTYGDALRQALSDARLRLDRVGAKAAHDYAEIFDGVRQTTIDVQRMQRYAGQALAARTRLRRVAADWRNWPEATR